MQGSKSLKNKWPKTEYVFNPDLEPFEQEIHILTYLQTNYVPNAKKMLKLAAKLKPMHPRFIQISLFETFAVTRDPLKWLQRCFKEMVHYAEIMKDLMENGYHGMIMEGPTVFPVRLDVNKNWIRNKDELWEPEQEQRIIDEALGLWLCENRRFEFIGRIVLFRDFGFSGMPIHIEQQWPLERRRELKALWDKEDAKKEMEELAKYLALDAQAKEEEQKKKEEQERELKRTQRKMSKAQRQAMESENGQAPE